MPSIEEEIEEIEEEIRNTPYNKSTEHHIGRLKGKLAKLKEELEQKQQAGGGGQGYDVEKTGDATVGLVGPPSAGKSTLLNALTDAGSEVADYEFTTLDVVPGMMKHRGANVQILDLPGLISGASEGIGRGRQVLSVVRTTDLLLLVTDVDRPEAVGAMVDELDGAGVRLNQEPPRMHVQQRQQGGLDITHTEEWGPLSEGEAEAILEEYGVHNADVTIRETMDADRFVDGLSRNRVYLPAFAVLNKTDTGDADLDADMPVVRVSATEGTGLDELRDRIWEALDLMRVYLKPQGGEADMDEPLILRRPATVEEVAERVHRDVERRFRYAVVTGESAKYPDQQVGLDHELADEDIVTIVTKKKLS